MKEDPKTRNDSNKTSTDPDVKSEFLSGHKLPLVLALLPLLAVAVLLGHKNPIDTELSGHPSGITLGDDRPGVFRPMPISATLDENEGTGTIGETEQSDPVEESAEGSPESINGEVGELTLDGTGTSSSNEEDPVVPGQNEPPTDAGQELLQTHCSGCHDLDTTLYSESEWARWVGEMATFVDLSDDQLLQIEQLVPPDVRD